MSLAQLRATRNRRFCRWTDVRRSGSGPARIGARQRRALTWARPVPERPLEDGPGCVGLTGMMAVLVVWAFAGTVGGLTGIVIAVAAVGLLYLTIGAVLWMGRRTPPP